MTERDYSAEPAFTAPAETPSDVILAITRAQLHALRWCSSTWHQARSPDPGTRVRDSLRSKGLAKAMYRGYRRDRYTLTPAGRALLRALELLHPAQPRKRAP